MTAAGIGERPDHSLRALARRLIVNLIAWGAALVRPARARSGFWRSLGSASHLIGAFAIAVAVTAALMVFVDPGEIAFHQRFPLWMLSVAAFVSDCGKSGWFLVPSAAILLVVAAVASPALGRITYVTLVSIAGRAGFIFVGIGLPGLIETIAKRLIGRARPPLYHATGPYDFVPFSWKVEYASMPSGHATNVFAAAIVIGSVFPRLRVVVWTYAILVGLSRNVLAAHYPSDVFAGAVVGSLGALAVRWWFATHRIGFALGPDGAVHAKPGPSWRRVKRVARRVFGQ
jgi:membrane-associated phospholipid phosphatase